MSEERRVVELVDEEFDFTRFLEQDSNDFSISPIQSNHTNYSNKHSNNQSSRRHETKLSSRVDRIVSPKFRSIFPFSNFNMLQHKALPMLFYNRCNVVVASPTASGKTVCMELALIEMLESRSEGKVVYVAPNKALCQERFDDWKQKFERPHGLVCEMLTGDSERKGLDQKIANSRLILTTPEKFDSFTRRWNDKQALIGQIRLLLIDEIHTLNEKRGGTLEAVVTRMKTTSKSSHCIEKNWPVANLRIVALSATLPNAIDIANWLECPRPNGLIVFGDEARPVKLERHVFGYPTKRNPYMFMNSLLSKIDGVIQDMSDGCPSLVFCATRKDCERVAVHLAGLSDDHVTLSSSSSSSNSYVKSASHQQELRRASNAIQDNEILKQCMRNGVCFHSAALSVSNRKIVERIFRSGKLAVCCTTTTLAQGVNLPARLVVVMSTLQWRGTKRGYVEYDRSTVLQMIGRAGRPQYDKVARAVIMTQQSTRKRYDDELQNGSVVESNLKDRLVDFMNSEIALGTVNSKASAIAWIERTFFYIRARENPRAYGIPGDMTEADLKRYVSIHIDTIIKRLVNSGMSLINDDDDGDDDNTSLWSATDTGRLMCRYFLRFETVQQFESFHRDPDKIVKGIRTRSASDEDDMFRILLLLSKCHELIEIGIRREEKKPLRKFRGRFEMPNAKGALDASKKCFQVLQARCSESTGQNIASKTLQMQRTQILENANRVLAGMQTFFKSKESPYLGSTIVLTKCLEQRMWENSHLVSMQIRGVGVSTANKLAQAGLTSFQHLETSATNTIQRICGRRHPFGANLKSKSRKLVGKSLCLSTKEEPGDNDDDRTTFRISVDHRFGSKETRREGSKKIQYKLLAWIATSTVRSNLILNMNVSTPTNVLVDVSKDDLKSLQQKMESNKKTNSPLVKLRFVLKCKLLSEKIIGIDDHTSTLITFGKMVDANDGGIANGEIEQHVTPHNSSKKRSFVSSSSSSKKCRHRCKDKRVCGHLCCREGLKNPRTSSDTRRTNVTSNNNTLKQHFKRKRALNFSSPPQRVKSKSKTTTKLSQFRRENQENVRFQQRKDAQSRHHRGQVSASTSNSVNLTPSLTTSSTRKRSSTLSNALNFAASSRYRFDETSSSSQRHYLSSPSSSRPPHAPPHVETDQSQADPLDSSYIKWNTHSSSAFYSSNPYGSSSNNAHKSSKNTYSSNNNNTKGQTLFQQDLLRDSTHAYSNNTYDVNDMNNTMMTNSSSDFGVSDNDMWSCYNDEDVNNLSPYDFEMESLIETSYVPSPPKKRHQNVTFSYSNDPYSDVNSRPLLTSSRKLSHQQQNRERQPRGVLDTNDFHVTSSRHTDDMRSKQPRRKPHRHRQLQDQPYRNQLQNQSRHRQDQLYRRQVQDQSRRRQVQDQSRRRQIQHDQTFRRQVQDQSRCRQIQQDQPQQQRPSLAFEFMNQFYGGV